CDSVCELEVDAAGGVHRLLGSGNDEASRIPAARTRCIDLEDTWAVVRQAVPPDSRLAVVVRVRGDLDVGRTGLTWPLVVGGTDRMLRRDGIGIELVRGHRIGVDQGGLDQAVREEAAGVLPRP